VCHNNLYGMITKNSKENIEILRKIAKKVNDYLDPIVEKTFDIRVTIKIY
jgi:hypothetical protein